MKKYLAWFLCLAMTLAMLSPLSSATARDVAADGGTQIEASKALIAPNLKKVDGSWGKPAIHVTKDTENADLHPYTDGLTPEDSDMDIYLQWDSENLYLAVVSPETDPHGNSAAWEGDGIQFKLEFNNTITDAAKDLHFTLANDNVSVTSCGTLAAYKPVINLVNGKMEAITKIPFADLGMVASDVKAGTVLAFDIIRISSTAASDQAGPGESESGRDGSYAGWLAWGAFFGIGSSNHPKATKHNTIVLSAEAIQNANIIDANKAAIIPNLKKVDGSWGKPAIHVDKNTDNADLHPYTDGLTPEDSDMDIYLQWDSENLYLAVVSPETDPHGNSAAWEGDGIQFKLEFNNTITDAAKDLHFTLANDNVSVTSCGTLAAYKPVINLVNGKMEAITKIPFADLGMVASDVKAGTVLAFDIIRISSTAASDQAGPGESEDGRDGSYAGWLAWGAFFGIGSSNHPKATAHNGIRLIDEKAKNANLVEARKADGTPNLTKVDNTWGKAAIHVDKNTENADLHAYTDGLTPEDSDMDIYLQWDSENLYLAVVSPETDPHGNSAAWEGDGIQFKLEFNNTITDAAKDLHFTLANDNVSVTSCGTLAAYNPVINLVDGKMEAITKIPFADLGMVASDVKAGTVLAFDIIRISSTAASDQAGPGESESGRDGSYAGWLAWGAFFGIGSSNHPKATAHNGIILSDKSANLSTQIEAKRASIVPNLKKVDGTWGKAAIHVDKNTENADLHAYTDGLTPEDSDMDIYLQWDSENLYLAVVSPETDPHGNSAAWEGDGIQFKLEFNNTITDAAKDLHFTLANDNVSVTSCGTLAAYKPVINLVDGKMEAITKIPFADLGMVASDVKAGTVLAFDIIRISSTAASDQAGPGESEDGRDGSYAGWLAWGAFFGIGSSNHPNATAHNAILLSGELAENGNVIEANRAAVVPNLKKVDGTWGKAAIHVDKNTENADLHAYTDGLTPEDSDMDIYLQWDSENLYLAVVSPETDPHGNSAAWEGDGIQFKLEFNNTITDAAKDLHFTLANDNVSVTSCGTLAAYKPVINLVNGKMEAITKIPFADLGMVASDVKAGTVLAFDIIRISSTAASDQAGPGESESGRDGSYAGWLAWGAFFGIGSSNHPNATAHNAILLSGELAENGNVIEANRAAVVPNLKKVDGTWGKAAIHVDKNTENADLHAYTDGLTPEDSDMDIYLQWDSENLYLAVVSPETDPHGNSAAWEGDGIQFKLEFNNTITDAAKDLHFTLANDNVSVTSCGTLAAYNPVINLVDGKMEAITKIPFADLGMVASDVKAGTVLAFDIIRISSTAASDQAGPGESESGRDGSYAGWLAWGAFFGIGSSNHPNATAHNAILLSGELAENGNVIEANKAVIAPNLTKVDGTWGKAAIHVDKNTENADLHAYTDGLTPEDSDMDIYLQWDSENLYLAVVSPETDPHGNSAAWEGDGIQFKLEFNNTITDAAKDLHFTLANDNVSVTSCGTLAAYKPVINLVNGKMEAITKIPFADLGMVASDVKAGTVLAFDIIRISSTAASDQAGPGESEDGRDGSYAGWLAWGAFFGIGSSNHPKATAHNAIVLSDAAAENGGNDEPEFVSQIINLAKEAGVTIAEDGLAYGHKVVTVNGVTYAVITTQSSLFKAGYMNELTLLKVQDKTVTVEAISYTYAGLEDVIAGEDGKIYILGGATGKDFRQFSSRYSVDGYENEAFLATWIYDPTTGVMMEHTAYAAFETAEADNFSYLGSAIDEAGLLYVAYIENKTNAPVVEYFAFDPDTLTWDKTAHVLTTNGTVESSFVYVGESGLEMVTAGSEGINIVTAENSSNVAPAGAALKDASQKNDGTLRIVYMNNGKLNYFEAGMAEAVQLNIEVAAEAGINLTTVNKWTLVAVMDADSLKASFYAFTDTANIYALNEILLDEAVLANTADMVMIARKDSQSLQDASVEFMIPGKRGITAGWYFAAITADMSTLPQ